MISSTTSWAVNEGLDERTRSVMVGRSNSLAISRCGGPQAIRLVLALGFVLWPGVAANAEPGRALTAWPDIDGRSEVEIGYRLARSAWERGYATEAARAVRDHAFGALGLGRLIALIDPANTASRRRSDSATRNRRCCPATTIRMTYTPWRRNDVLSEYNHPEPSN